MKAYDRFLAEHPQPWCWACGRTAEQVPPWWGAAWLIERSHVVHKPRLEDPRVIVLLCSGDHRTSHGERFPQWTLPRLTLENLLWLKLRFDPERFDPELLQRCSVPRVPEPVPLPDVFIQEYLLRHPQKGTDHEFCQRPEDFDF